MTAPKIKDCPKCGPAGEVAVFTYENGWRHVECGVCWKLGPGERSIIQAIKSWNADAACPAKKGGA